jgi:hypothetical protein
MSGANFVPASSWMARAQCCASGRTRPFDAVDPREAIGQSSSTDHVTAANEDPVNRSTDGEPFTVVRLWRERRAPELNGRIKSLPTPAVLPGPMNSTSHVHRDFWSNPRRAGSEISIRRQSLVLLRRTGAPSQWLCRLPATWDQLIDGGFNRSAQEARRASLMVSYSRGSCGDGC